MTGNFIALGGESGVVESVVVESGEESNVTASGADVTGDLTSLGTATQADVYVQYRKFGDFIWQTTSVQTVSSTGEFTATISLAISGGIVQWRAVAEGDNGTSDVGEIEQFPATDEELAVTTDPESDVTTSEATLNATVDTLGPYSSVLGGFEYRQVGGTWRWRISGEVTEESYEYVVDNLADGTDYEYRARADADDGTIVRGGAEAFTTAGVIDDFERGNLDPYDGDTGNYTVQSGTVNSGSNALENDGTSALIHSTSGLDRYPQAGDTFEYYYRIPSGDAACQFRFGWQDSLNYYRITNINDSGFSNEVSLVEVSGGSGTTLGEELVTTPSGVWCRNVVEWGANGSITVTFYDETGTQFAQPTGTSTAFTSGGIEFFARDRDDGNSPIYFDDVQII